MKQSRSVFFKKRGCNRILLLLDSRQHACSLRMLRLLAVIYAPSVPLELM